MSFIGDHQDDHLLVQNENQQLHHIEQRSNSSFSSQSGESIEIQRVWNFNYGVFHQNRIATILSYIGQAFVQQAYLGTNQNQQIPSVISHINFTYLRILNLQTNHIKSIEILQYLKVPELKQLNLKNNQITNLRVFRKLKWLKIETITLQKNFCVNNDSLIQSSLDCLQKLCMEVDTDQKISQNINSIIKLNSKYLNQLNCPSKKRIIDPHLFHQMKNRYRKTIPPHDQNQQVTYSQLRIIQRKKNY